MKRYVVVDLEMCKVPKGYKKEFRCGREIIQIGAVLLDQDFNIYDTFNEYVKPEYGKLDKFITNLTGITEDNLSDADKLSNVLRGFEEWLPDGELVGISWSDTDNNQLIREVDKKSIYISSKLQSVLARWVDCQPQFSDKMKMEKLYSLEEALIATDICTEGRAHDGLVDAYNTGLLFAKMQREAELVLNPYYEVAHSDEDLDSLNYSLGDLLLAAGF